MAIRKYNIIFIGTPEFSVPTLKALISDERFNVAAVVTAPDAKVGRKQVMTPPPVKAVAKKYNIPVFQPKSLKKTPLSRLGEALGVRVDIIITIAYGQILPKEILEMPKHGCLNLHASLLPKYRGASPIQTAIANGETETGVTLMKMNAGIDTGPVIAQEKIKISPEETGDSLHDKLSKLSAQVIIKYLPDYPEGKITAKKQTNKDATLAPKLTRDSGHIDWNKPAVDIERLVRAYHPWPGTWTVWDGQKLKITSVSLSPEDTIGQLKLHDKKINAPGDIFLYKNKLAVRCGDGALLIEKLQLSGKKIMSAEEFLRGYRGHLSQ